MVRYKYPKNSRIGSKKDFQAIFNYKLFAKNDLMTVYLAPNDTQKVRFAVSLNAKIGSAVIRNRLKRLAREAFRLNKPSLPQNFDYLVIFSKLLSKDNSCDIRKLSFSRVRDSFLELVKQAKERFEKRQSKN